MKIHWTSTLIKPELNQTVFIIERHKESNESISISKMKLIQVDGEDKWQDSKGFNHHKNDFYGYWTKDDLEQLPAKKMAEEEPKDQEVVLVYVKSVPNWSEVFAAFEYNSGVFFNNDEIGMGLLTLDKKHVKFWLSFDDLNTPWENNSNSVAHDFLDGKATLQDVEDKVREEQVSSFLDSIQLIIQQYGFYVIAGCFFIAWAYYFVTYTHYLG
jgi:hypothetical protein